MMFYVVICCHLVLICSYYPSSEPSPTCLLATIHVKYLLIFPPPLLLTCLPSVSYEVEDRKREPFAESGLL